MLMEEDHFIYPIPMKTFRFEGGLIWLIVSRNVKISEFRERDF